MYADVNKDPSFEDRLIFLEREAQGLHAKIAFLEDDANKRKTTSPKMPWFHIKVNGEVVATIKSTEARAHKHLRSLRTYDMKDKYLSLTPDEYNSHYHWEVSLI